LINEVNSSTHMTSDIFLDKILGTIMNLNTSKSIDVIWFKFSKVFN